MADKTSTSSSDKSKIDKEKFYPITSLYNFNGYFINSDGEDFLSSSEEDGIISTNWIEVKESPDVVNLNSNVFDVSAYLLKKTGTISTVKLQKLVYYCQAWSLVWDDKPIFNEKIHAWVNGPVVKELYYFHKGWFDISNVSIGNPDKLTENQKDTIDKVIDYYGDKASSWLVNLTHMESPWIEARKGLEPMERGDREITWESIAEYYSSL